MKHFFFYLISVVLFNACQNKDNSVYLDNLSWKEDSAAYAQNFAIQFYNNDTRILIFKSENRLDTLSKIYIGNKNIEKTNYISGKTNGFACLSAVYAGYLDALNQSAKIKFIDNGKYLYSKRLKQLFDEKKMQSCATNGQLNLELLAENKVMILAYETDGSTNSDIIHFKRLKLPYMICTDFKEKHPLGRAEWLKVFGILCGELDNAETLFNEIAVHYQATKLYCEQNITEKPTVMLGALFGGNWNVSGGKSFIAALIGDAAANYSYYSYPSQDNRILPFEKVFEDCKNAQIWLNPNAYSSLKDLAEADIRYTLFKPFSTKQVFNNTKMINADGANAFWESGVVRPDILLRDFAICFHPNYFIGEQTVFFKPLD